MKIIKINCTLAVIFFLLLVISCTNEGPAEKAGSRIDEIADNIKEGEPPLKEKGTMEKAGEAADQAMDKFNNQHNSN